MPDEKPPINLDDIDFGHTIRGHQKGDRVFERFILQRLLGRGGMGVVWLAQDERLGREVALKFAPEAVRYDDVAVDELKEETRKGLNLAHPGIVKIYDFLLDEDHAAISMEFIDGENLGALRTRQPNKVFEAPQLAHWAAQILEALDYAHRVAKVIHRDLKPANLMIDREGNLRVTDFGIARSISDAMNRATMAVGNSTGTLAYMSPQQADGKKPHVSDDLYAFGSTLYELMTGKPPFFSGNIIHQLKEDAVQSLTERRQEFGIVNAEPIPVEWEQTILACLEKSPENRPSSAQVVRQRLGLAPAIPSEMPPMPLTSMGTAVHGMGEPTSFSGGHHTSHAGATQTYVRAGAGLTEINVPSRPIGAGAIKMGPGAGPATPATHGGVEPVKQKSSSAIIWIVLVVLLMGLVTVGGAGWWAYNNLPLFKKQEPPKVVVTNPPPTPLPKPDPAPVPPKVDPVPVPRPPDPDPAPTPTPTPTPPPRPADPVPQTPAPAGAKFTTIQAAINAAKAGETVVIPEGLYEEQLRLKPGLKLKAEVPGKVVVQTDGEVGSALLAENCNGASVTGFVFQHAGQDAAEKTNWPVVMIKSSSLVIENCTIRAGIGDGLYVTGAGKIQITRCVIEKNLGHGLVFESGASGLVADCESRRNGENGAEARFNGTSPTFERCTFTENGLSGIAVRDGAEVTVTAQTVCKGNIEAGVAAGGEGVRVIMQAVVCEGNLMGVSVQKQAFCKLSDCRILLSKEVGIHLDMPATGSEVLNNEVEKSKMDGILATAAPGATVSIVGNKLKGNAGNGLLIYGAGFKPRVEQNECSTNAKYGILAIEGVVGTIQENTVRGNHLGSIVNSGGGAGLVIQGNIADESGR